MHFLWVFFVKNLSIKKPVFSFFYRCDAYVKAWKRLVIHKAPNILTIALKRFQVCTKSYNIHSSQKVQKFMGKFSDSLKVWFSFWLCLELVREIWKAQQEGGIPECS